MAAVLLAGLAVLRANPPTSGFPPSLKPGCLPGTEGQQDIFCPGQYNYGCMKIPTLLRIPNTTRLLAFIEARKYSCDDHGYVDLLLKTSDDLGRAWSAPSLVYGNSTALDWHTIGDALPIYDRQTGEVHLIFTRDNTEVYYTKSARVAVPGTTPGEGGWWDISHNISASAVAKPGKGFIGTGHALGLQLSNGTLLAPLYGGGSNSFVLRSDTHGRAWHISGVLDAPANEWAFVPIKTGVEHEHHLLASLRSEPSRRQAWSTDAGVTWTPTVAVPGLPEPIEGCEASLLLHPSGVIFYAHPQPAVPSAAPGAREIELLACAPLYVAGTQPTAHARQGLQSLWVVGLT